MHTITVIVPAHNEEEGLPATLESLACQTVRPDRILVVDDASTDRTGEVAASHGVTVLRPPHNLGSKAKAQNYALPHCTTDLVLAVDADTVLAPDYIETVVPVFGDPDVSVAAGTVRTRRTHTVWERGRSTEYLFGFHWHRPIQARANSPMVCSGCCSVFRRDDLMAFGGFPERTIVEDMDYTCVPLGGVTLRCPWLGGKHAGQMRYLRRCQYVRVRQGGTRSGRADADPMLTFLTGSQEIVMLATQGPAGRRQSRAEIVV